jgi:hypothetical protein
MFLGVYGSPMLQAMVGLGTSIWTVCRLCRVPLRFPQMIIIAGFIVTYVLPVLADGGGGP